MSSVIAFLAQASSTKVLPSVAAVHQGGDGGVVEGAGQAGGGPVKTGDGVVGVPLKGVFRFLSTSVAFKRWPSERNSLPSPPRKGEGS